MSNPNAFFEQLNEDIRKNPFDLNTIDYSILDKHKENLKLIASTNRSVVCIFDLLKKENVFISESLPSIIGDIPFDSDHEAFILFKSKMHPDDRELLFENAGIAFKYFMSQPIDQRKNLKMVIEYRVQNANGEYVRLIDQFQMLEMDGCGCPWLSLCISDMSPNQEQYDGIRCQMIDFINYEVKDVKFKVIKNKLASTEIAEKASKGIKLTKREVEILGLIANGLLSKEISEKVQISLNTVNRHRQNILEKLNANNSIEALKLATQLGLI